MCERVDAGSTDKDEVCSLRGQDVRRILAEEFGLLRSLSGVYWLLHRLGDRDLRPRPRHRKNDSLAMETFRSSWPDQIQAIAAAHPGQRLRVDFATACRMQQQFPG